MNADANLIEDLARRARAGDGAALAELHEQIVVHVRQALRGGTGRPEFDETARTLARRLGRYALRQPPDPERLARRVARCLCDALCDRLGGELSPAQRLQETLVA
jgi:hypothetical protein